MPNTETLFTPTQKEVMDLMWETKTEAKVRRRVGNHEEGMWFEEVVRPTSPIDFAQNGEFALKLHETKPEAPLSPYYVNLRGLPENLLIKVAEAIAESTEETGAEVCVGIPNAGDPIAEKFSAITNIPIVKIFGKAESASSRKIVPSTSAPRGVRRLSNLLLIDDLVTEAGTKFEAAQVAEGLGYNIAGIAILVDRQQGGREQLETKGYKLFAPLPISGVFEYYLSTGRIDQRKYSECMSYLNAARTESNLPQLELVI